MSRLTPTYRPPPESQAVPAFIVVQITIADPATYARYRAQYGGRYLVRGGPTTVLEGTWQPSRLVILEFPHRAQAQAWWDSPEYAPAKALRQQSAATEMLLIDGSVPDVS